MILRDERIVQVGVGDSVIAGGNMRRTGIVISSPPTYVVFVRFAGPAANGFGLAIYPGTVPVVLTEDYVGSALHEEVHCISPGGAQNIYMLDLFTG